MIVKLIFTQLVAVTFILTMLKIFTKLVDRYLEKKSYRLMKKIQIIIYYSLLIILSLITGIMLLPKVIL